METGLWAGFIQLQVSSVDRTQEREPTDWLPCHTHQRPIEAKRRRGGAGASLRRRAGRALRGVVLELAIDLRTGSPLITRGSAACCARSRCPQRARSLTHRLKAGGEGGGVAVLVDGDVGDYAAPNNTPPRGAFRLVSVGRQCIWVRWAGRAACAPFTTATSSAAVAKACHNHSSGTHAH